MTATTAATAALGRAAGKAAARPLSSAGLSRDPATGLVTGPDGRPLDGFAEVRLYSDGPSPLGQSAPLVGWAQLRGGRFVVAPQTSPDVVKVVQAQGGVVNAYLTVTTGSYLYTQDFVWDLRPRDGAHAASARERRRAPRFHVRLERGAAGVLELPAAASRVVRHSLRARAAAAQAGRSAPPGANRFCQMNHFDRVATFKRDVPIGEVHVWPGLGAVFAWDRTTGTTVETLKTNTITLNAKTKLLSASGLFGMRSAMSEGDAQQFRMTIPLNKETRSRVILARTNFGVYRYYNAGTRWTTACKGVTYAVRRPTTAHPWPVEGLDHGRDVTYHDGRCDRHRHADPLVPGGTLESHANQSYRTQRGWEMGGSGGFDRVWLGAGTGYAKTFVRESTHGTGFQLKNATPLKRNVGRTIYVCANTPNETAGEGRHVYAGPRRVWRG